MAHLEQGPEIAVDHNGQGYFSQIIDEVASESERKYLSIIEKGAFLSASRNTSQTSEKRAIFSQGKNREKFPHTSGKSISVYVSERASGQTFLRIYARYPSTARIYEISLYDWKNTQGKRISGFVRKMDRNTQNSERIT